MVQLCTISSCAISNMTILLIKWVGAPGFVCFLSECPDQEKDSEQKPNKANPNQWSADAFIACVLSHLTFAVRSSYHWQLQHFKSLISTPGFTCTLYTDKLNWNLDSMYPNGMDFKERVKVPPVLNTAHCFISLLVWSLSCLLYCATCPCYFVVVSHR